MFIFVVLFLYIYIYIYIYIYNIHNDKTDYLFQNIFRLMSLSIHSLFTIKSATNTILESISDNYCRKLVHKN